MTADDRAAFATLMLGIGETYGEPVSDARMEIYFAALVDLDLAAIRAAATEHVRTSKFFPRPAELREAVDGSADDRAELAWAATLQLVRRYGYYTVPPAEAWPDPATEAAAMTMYGGWQQLCAKMPGEGPELLGVAKMFKAAYVAYDGHARRGLVLPMGRERGRLDSKQALSSLKDALTTRGLPANGL